MTFIIIFQCNRSQAASLPKEIKLVSAPWVNGARDDGTGIYWDIMRLVYEPIGIKVEYNTTDYARSIALVKQGEMDAWLGSYLDEEENVIYPKWHFDADVVVALYKKSPDFQWLGENSLAGKNIGWIKGYNYHKYIDTQFNNKEFKTREEAIELLENGQLDFFLEAQIEVKDEIKKGSLDSTKFEYNTLMNLNIFPAFSDNARGLQLQKIFDARFAKLLKSGEIKKLFDKWNWPIYPFTILCNYASTSMVSC
ncbi:substrate-binding periplasmic protein [Psychromonas sp.]|uniref:substrate-binding periplasmic protein n=1 Tax=Psychromonas sp. TaxID=1884585 RepID=UPI0039E2BD37